MAEWVGLWDNVADHSRLKTPQRNSYSQKWAGGAEARMRLCTRAVAAALPSVSECLSQSRITTFAISLPHSLLMATSKSVLPVR